jgi:putative transposase
MKRKRFSTEQIVAAMKQHELGMPAAEIIRKLGIAEQTFYRWKRQYGGLDPEQARELKQLREENARLKKLVADLSLDKAMLADVVKNKW